MKKGMGDSAVDAFVKKHTDSGTAQKGRRFYYALRDWMEAHKLFMPAKLRRADSARAPSLGQQESPQQ